MTGIYLLSDFIYLYIYICIYIWHICIYIYDIQGQMKENNRGWDVSDELSGSHSHCWDHYHCPGQKTVVHHLASSTSPFFSVIRTMKPRSLGLRQSAAASSSSRPQANKWTLHKLIISTSILWDITSNFSFSVCFNSCGFLYDTMDSAYRAYIISVKYSALWRYIVMRPFTVSSLITVLIEGSVFNTHLKTQCSTQTNLL